MPRRTIVKAISGLTPTTTVLGAAQPRHLGDRPEGVRAVAVEHVERGHVDDHAAAALVPIRSTSASAKRRISRRPGQR
jgi:hypothetical protein